MSIERELRGAVRMGEEYAGTLPAKDAVKVRPQDWHNICDLARAASDELSRLRKALVIIREGRGKCKLCGKQAEGMGPGYVSCDDDRRCAWTEQDPQEIAARALSEREGRDG